jgi:hypothetical protein
MPQATEEERAGMRARFNSIDTAPIGRFLISKGWQLSRDWNWHKKGITNYGEIPDDELDCIIFLNHEWDYGVVKFQD